MNTTFLVSIVHNTRRFSGFFQDTNLVLSTTAVVVRNWRRNSLEPVVSLGIVNTEGTVQRPKIVSITRPNSRNLKDAPLLNIHRNRKVLPHPILDPPRPNHIILPIQNLPQPLIQLGRIRLALFLRIILREHHTRINRKLVRRIIIRLMPHSHILMREVHRVRPFRPANLPRAPMERLHTDIRRVGPIAHQQPRTPEPELHLAPARDEERPVVDGHLERFM